MKFGIDSKLKAHSRPDCSFGWRLLFVQYCTLDQCDTCERAAAATQVSPNSEAENTNEESPPGGAQLDQARDTSTAGAPDEQAASKNASPVDADDDGEEDEEGCAFCKFMKGGGCKAEFEAWEKCVADSRESGDFVGQCADITEALQACMNHTDNKDYYQLFLDDQEEYVRDQREKDQQEATAEQDVEGKGSSNGTNNCTNTVHEVSKVKEADKR